MSSATADAEVKIRPANLLYAVDEWPPTARLLLLGVQYAVMDAIYLVLVAIILRHAHASPQTSMNVMGAACVAAAIGIALQALPRGSVGSGYLAPPVFSATYLAPSVLAAQVGGIPLVCGMTLFAGLVEILIGLALNRLRIVVTPVLSGLTVFVVGLQLGIVGIGAALDVTHEELANYPLHLTVAFGTLAVCVTLSIWARGTLRLLGTLIGLGAGLAAATTVGFLQVGPLSLIGNAGWIAAPHLVGPLSFSLLLVPAFAAAALAAAMRTTGVVTTCQRLNDAGWRRPDIGNIKKGVLADGLATLISGALGAPGMSAAPSLVGISGTTGATSRVIGFAAALILFVVAFSPKLSNFFLLVPHEIAGALLVFTSSFMIVGGMEIMMARRSDARTVYVIGISTLLMLSHTAFPDYYRVLPEVLRSFAGNSLALALGPAIVLTLLFRIRAGEQATVAWDVDQPGSIGAVTGFLRARAESWKIPGDVREVAIRNVEDLLGYLKEAHAHRLSGMLDARYDGFELRINIFYPGTKMVLLPAAHESTETARPPALDTEEAAVIQGLQSFLQHIPADHKQIKLRRDRVMVRLSYAA